MDESHKRSLWRFEAKNDIERRNFMEGKNKKTKVFKWVAVLLLAAMMIGGCK